MPRTESECTNTSIDDDELSIVPILDVGLPVGPAGDEENVDNGRTYVTLRERRQIKLGLRKVVLLLISKLAFEPKLHGEKKLILNNWKNRFIRNFWMFYWKCSDSSLSF